MCERQSVAPTPRGCQPHADRRLVSPVLHPARPPLFEVLPEPIYVLPFNPVIQLLKNDPERLPLTRFHWVQYYSRKNIFQCLPWVTGLVLRYGQIMKDQRTPRVQLLQLSKEGNHGTIFPSPAQRFLFLQCRVYLSLPQLHFSSNQRLANCSVIILGQSDTVRPFAAVLILYHRYLNLIVFDLVISKELLDRC